jgi:tetratricopeptide (TPR) repeat protein
MEPGRDELINNLPQSSSLQESLEARLAEVIAPGERARALNALAEYWRPRNMPRALELTEEAIAEAEVHQLDPEHGVAIRLRGLCRLIQSNFAAAEKDYEAALVISRRCGDRKTEAAAVVGLSTIARKGSRYLEATKLLLQGRQIRREINDLPGEISALNNLGALNLELGNFSAAMTFLEEGVCLARQSGDVSHELFCRSNAARIRKDAGELEEALTELESCLALAASLGNTYIRPHLLSMVCEILLQLGRIEEALRINEEGLAIAQQGDDHQVELSLLLNLGNICEELGMSEAAEAAISRALERTERLGDDERHREAQLQLAYLRLRQGALPEAKRYFNEIHRSGKLIGGRQLIAKSCRGLAEIADREGDAVAAAAFREESKAIELEWKEQARRVTALLSSAVL